MEQGMPPRPKSGTTLSRADTVQDAARSLKIGGRYLLGEVIGSGGSAAVYRSLDTLTGEEVAVKLFHPDLPDSSQHRHHEELRLFRGLRHRGVVAIHDGGTHQGRTYLVMPLVTGPTLAERLAEGPLPVQEAVRIGAELADALEYLHDARIVHRDVKPANVLLSPDGAKLSDFGIARYRDATRITATGDVVGTAAYMAPEQVRSLPVGPEADIFSLGLVLLECLSGQREYPGGIVESAVARLHRSPTIPRDVPGELADLLRRMTHQRPNSRASASDVIAALGTPGSGRALLPHRIPGSPFRLPHLGRRLALAMFGTPAAALVALIIGAGSLSGTDPVREAHPAPDPAPPSTSAAPSSSARPTPASTDHTTASTRAEPRTAPPAKPVVRDQPVQRVPLHGHPGRG